MKITTRIATSYLLFIAILMALAVYQILTIKGIQSVNRSLTGAGFQNARACLEALREMDFVEEYTKEAFAVLADPDRLEKLQESQNAFDARISEIKTYAEWDGDTTEVKRLSLSWREYLAEHGALLQNPPKTGGALPKSLQNSLDQLRSQTLTIYQAALVTIDSNAEKSGKTLKTAALVLYCAIVIAFTISILVSFLILRSISKPLANLTEGMRTLAEGKLSYRLDTSGNDELSQIAKDVNSLTRRLNELEKQK
jgi:methyl-accepting chemotaxis protein